MYGRKFGARSIGENRRAITTRDGRDYPLAGGGWHKEAAASNALDAIAGQRGLRNNPPPLMETEMPSITYALRE